MSRRLVLDHFKPRRGVRLLIRRLHRQEVALPAAPRRVDVGLMLPLRGPRATVRVPESAVELREPLLSFGDPKQMICADLGDRFALALEIREKRRGSEPRVRAQVVVDRGPRRRADRREREEPELVVILPEAEVQLQRAEYLPTEPAHALAPDPR